MRLPILAALALALTAPARGQATITDAAAPAEPVAAAAKVNRFGLSEPKPRTPGTVRLATYNLLNFCDHVDDPALTGDIDDMSLAVAPERCVKLAEAITAIDADVVALQEIESLEALAWFRDNWLPDAGYDHLASEDVGYFRGIECSVMSRFPIVEVRTWPQLSLADVERTGVGWDEVPSDRAESIAFRRSPIMVTVQFDPEDPRSTLTIFSLHHKSGRNSWWREAEALKIVELIDEIRFADPDRRIAVMGDFNAAPWYKSFRVYQEAGFVDTLAHRVIPRRRGGPGDAETVLYKTHESNRVLDYILLNPTAYRDFVVGSAFVYGTLTPPESYDWRKDPHPEGYASDHYPVVIDFRPVGR